MKSSPDPDPNPFKLGVESDAHLLPWQHTVGLVTASLVAAVFACLGIFLLWQGYRFYLVVTLQIDPDESLLSQIDGVQLAGLIVVSLLMVAGAAFCFLMIRHRIDAGIRRHREQQWKRTELEKQVSDLHNAVKNQATSADQDIPGG